MVAEHTFHTGTVDLNYAEGEASGPPIVLLHGGSLRWQSVMPLIPDLAARWHVYAPDLRGHGRSGRVPGRYRLQDYASDVALFLEQVVTAPAILFGHSLGGHVAILVAALHPELVRAWSSVMLRSTAQGCAPPSCATARACSTGGIWRVRCTRWTRSAKA